jgi:hypothetical protein
MVATLLKASSPTVEGSQEGLPTVPILDLSQSPGGTLAFRLPVGSTPRVPGFEGLLGCTAQAVIWIGATVASIVVIVARPAERTGRFGAFPTWLAALGLIAFVLVALAILTLFLYPVVKALVTFGVGPTTLEVSDHPLVPGGRCEVFLSQSGRPKLNMTSLRVLLICEEEAKYPVEGATRTETRRVFEEGIIARERIEAYAGSPFEVRGELRVPPGAMHSFVALHNQVRWKVVVQGQSALGPNFEREYPIVILPSPEVAK